MGPCHHSQVSTVPQKQIQAPCRYKRGRIAVSYLQRAETVENTWKHIRDSWKESCEERLGKKTRQHKEWASVETVKKIEERTKKNSKLYKQ